MNDYKQTIISQYANSPTMLQMMDNTNQWIDPQYFFTQFVEKIWDIDTALTFGLDLWGRILGISRRFYVIRTGQYLGFSGNDPDYQPFNQAPFYNGSSDADAVDLDNDTYRNVLLTKALINISNTSIVSLNAIVSRLFIGRGKCYVADVGSMAFTYTFEFTLTALDRAIINQLLPFPTGVNVSIAEV